MDGNKRRCERKENLEVHERKEKMKKRKDKNRVPLLFVYNTHSCIKRTPNFVNEILEKFLYIIRTDFFEFVAGIFNLNLT